MSSKGEGLKSRSREPLTQHVSCVELEHPAVGGQAFQSGMAYTGDLSQPPRRISDDAREGIAKEHRMTFLSGTRMYPRAMLWSALLSLTIVMEAYDKMLVGGFLASPAFRAQFGTSVIVKPDGTTTRDLTATWQAALVSSAFSTETLGLLLNGWLTDRYGYRKVMLGALIFLNLSIFVAFFATSLPMLLASQLLFGLPWGIFQTLSATYAAEVLPVALRTYLLANVNMCWLIGQVIGMGTIHGWLKNNSEWAYRVPFALQWAWSLPLLAVLYLCPEGPWWLVRHDRVDDARHSLERLTRKSSSELDVNQVISVMKYTDNIEKQLNQSGNSYLDCFKGTNLRRTEIAGMVWLTQAFCGGTLMGYAPYFYEQAGFPVEKSFSLTTGMFALGIVGNMIAWFLLRWFGRRTLYLVGELSLVLILMVGGIVSVVPIQPEVAYWTLGSFLLAFTLCYNLTIGPVCYVLVAEVPSTRLRVKTVVIARISFNLASIVNNQLIPRMLNGGAWDLKGRACWPLAGMAFLCLIWIYFRLPETKDLTYVELDILFDNKASTPKFREVKVNLESRGYLSLNRQEQSAGIWHGWLGYS